jgi:hypothetical protein
MLETALSYIRDAQIPLDCYTNYYTKRLGLRPLLNGAKRR